MSTCPGRYLEDYVKWEYDLLVEDTKDANASLEIADALGLSTKQRLVFTQEEFAELLNIFEPHREVVEHLLDEFDEEEQSWRGYTGCIDFVLPNNIDVEAWQIINRIKESKTTVIVENKNG